MSDGSLDHSDVLVPDELPSWHIESKGTKSPKLPASKVRLWFKQLYADTPLGKLAIVLHTANGHSPVALVNLGTYMQIATEIGQAAISAEESFSPGPELTKMRKGHRIFSSMTGKHGVGFTGVIAFEYDVDHTIIAMDADLWLKFALAYEERLKKKLEEAEKPRLEIVK